MRTRLLLVISLVSAGCGGAPFELAETTAPIEDVFDAGSPQAEAGAARDDAETLARDSGVDAQKEDVSETSVADASHEDVTDASPIEAATTAALCCLRGSTPTVCADRPWYCSAGGSSVANCAARAADGGSACQAGDSCGLVGGPVDAGVVGACQ